MQKHGLIVRLMIPLAIMIALAVTVLILSGRAGTEVREADAAIIAAQRRGLDLAELRSTSRSLQRDALNLVTEPDRDELAAIRRKFDGRVVRFANGLAALKPDATTESGDEFRTYMQSQHAVLRQLRVVRALATRDPQRALRRFRSVVRPEERRASTIADRLIDRLDGRADTLIARADAIATRQERLVNIATTASSIVAILLGLAVIVVTVVRPLRAIRQVMEALAGGNAQLAVPGADRGDEIGAMARAIEVFRTATLERDALRAARDAQRIDAAQAERSAAEVAQREAARESQRTALEAQRRALLQSLADAVEDSLSAVNDKLRGSAERLTHSAEEVARHAAAADEEAERTGRAADEVSRDLVASSAATSQIADGVVRLHAKADEATDAVGLAIARSRTAAARVSGLTAYADRVGEMIDLIKTVSQRSQLLALNATIEAARAGEVGRGFGVVAGEMKRLSAQAGATANHVERELAAIRTAAGEGSSAIEEIGEAIGQIEENAGRLVHSMREQGAANAEIGRTVATALASVDAVGGRMVELGRTAHSTRDLADGLRSDAELLSADAARVDTALRELVGRLKAA